MSKGKKRKRTKTNKKTKLKMRKLDDTDERQIITGMIVSPKVLREIQPMYIDKRALWQTPYAPRVAEWCLKFYRKYKKAPKQHIQDIFNSWARKNPDHPDTDLIARFLTNLSENYERATKFNAGLILDKAEETFRLNSLRRLNEDITAAITRSDTTGAEGLVTQYRRIERAASDGFNPYTDAEAIWNAFEGYTEPLIQIPGAAGELLNEFMGRECLVGFMGKEKIGKTWMLHEIGHRGLLSDCNVAEFQVGDMSGPTMTIRTHIRLAGKSNRKRYCEELVIPVLDCVRNQEGTCRRKDRTCDCDLNGAQSFEEAPPEYSPCDYCARKGKKRFQGAVWYEVRPKTKPHEKRAALRLGRRFMRNCAGDFRLLVRPNNSINVDGIEAILDMWEVYEDFFPDVVIIDYADILAPQPGDERKDTRDQQNNTWKALRALSQKKHCLVVSATQTDAASYEASLMKRKHFSEDKRKYGHVTVMFGMNQTDEEKAAGILRLNTVLAREEEFNPLRTVKLLQCLQIGRPLLASYW